MLRCWPVTTSSAPGAMRTSASMKTSWRSPPSSVVNPKSRCAAATPFQHAQLLPVQPIGRSGAPTTTTPSTALAIEAVWSVEWSSTTMINGCARRGPVGGQIHEKPAEASRFVAGRDDDRSLQSRRGCGCRSVSDWFDTCCQHPWAPEDHPTQDPTRHTEDDGCRHESVTMRPGLRSVQFAGPVALKSSPPKPDSRVDPKSAHGSADYVRAA
jgi:hypothetical protein